MGDDTLDNREVESARENMDNALGVLADAGGRDTFRPVSVDDRFRRRVREDHAPNAALHSAIKAAAEDDDRIASVNLMASHAPGNQHKGEPTYHVVVRIENAGMGDASLGPTFLDRMVKMGDVVIRGATSSSVFDTEDIPDGASAEEAAKQTIHDHTDRLELWLRPVETRVEPIDVPVDDIPDDVFDDEPDTLADATARGLGHAAVAELVDRDDRIGVHRRHVDADDEAIDAAIDAGVVVEEDGYLFDTRDVVRRVLAQVEPNQDAAYVLDTLAQDLRADGHDQAADRVEESASRLLDGDVDGNDTDVVACGCGDYSVEVSDLMPVEELDVVCPECGNHFGFGSEAGSLAADVDGADEDDNPFLPPDVVDALSEGRSPSPKVHLSLFDPDTGDEVFGDAFPVGESVTVDTGRGVWEANVGLYDSPNESAVAATVYRCHGCERRILPEDFVGLAVDDDPACPRCGTKVDWQATPPGGFDG